MYFPFSAISSLLSRVVVGVVEVEIAPAQSDLLDRPQPAVQRQHGRRPVGSVQEADERGGEPLVVLVVGARRRRPSLARPPSCAARRAGSQPSTSDRRSRRWPPIIREGIPWPIWISTQRTEKP